MVPLPPNQFIAWLIGHLRAGLLMADILYLGMALVSFAVLALAVMFCERL